jgi:hypothetical protein
MSLANCWEFKSMDALSGTNVKFENDDGEIAVKI